jgi:hypothetical protein
MCVMRAYLALRAQTTTPQVPPHVGMAPSQSSQPGGAHPDEIIAMLDAIPDMRDELARAEPSELAEIFEAFDVTATYDKRNRRLELAATVTSELVDGT